jgi:hypothetical protein
MNPALLRLSLAHTLMHKSSKGRVTVSGGAGTSKTGAAPPVVPLPRGDWPLEEHGGPLAPAGHVCYSNDQ